MPRWDQEEPPKEAPAVIPEKLPPPVPLPQPAVTAAPSVPAETVPEPVIERAPQMQASDAVSPAPAPAPRVSAPEAEAPNPLSLDKDQSTLKEGASPIKIGVLGGKGVGKSYLFQAMVYRMNKSDQAGALAYFMKNFAVRLSFSELTVPHWRNIAIPDFLEAYRKMVRLPATTGLDQKWYRLRLNFASGIRGTTPSTMNVEFLDGSGEVLELGASNPKFRDLWKRAYSDATVMFFCVPIWTLFPAASEMSTLDWEDRDKILKGYSRIVDTYHEVRNEDLKVRSVLVLTQADDRKSALRTLYRRWIEPCIEAKKAERFLNDMLSPSGLPRYLASAREISQYLYREFRRIESEGLVRDPSELNFGYGMPWIVPVSAVRGDRLEELEKDKMENRKPAVRPAPPLPAHVELPLLAALSEHYNALM